MFSDNETPRRIRPDEVRARLRIGDTWLRKLCAEGRFPKPRFDPGGRRRWWTSGEVDAAIAALAHAASATATLSGVARGASTKTLTRPEDASEPAARTDRATTIRKTVSATAEPSSAQRGALKSEHRHARNKAPAD